MINNYLLPRINQRLSFLYVKHAKIVKQELTLMQIKKNKLSGKCYGKIYV